MAHEHIQRTLEDAAPRTPRASIAMLSRVRYLECRMACLRNEAPPNRVDSSLDLFCDTDTHSSHGVGTHLHFRLDPLPPSTRPANYPVTPAAHAAALHGDIFSPRRRGALAFENCNIISNRNSRTSWTNEQVTDQDKAATRRLGQVAKAETGQIA